MRQFLIMAMAAMVLVVVNLAAGPTARAQMAICPNGICEYPLEDEFNCPFDCGGGMGGFCGDGQCDWYYGDETASNCPVDCDCVEPVLCGCPGMACTLACLYAVNCGDGVCVESETYANCPSDCTITPCCGNDLCAYPETLGNCAADCDTCGNAYCGPDESHANCPMDCPQCGDALCSYPLEDSVSCSADCTCTDADGDGRGQYCHAGTDCDDANPNVWNTCAACLDQDGDGWFTGCNQYLTVNGPDCDDHADTGAGCNAGCAAFYLDADSDGRGLASSSVTRCAAPAGYVAVGGDCNDTNTNVWSACASCLDSDGDGWYAGCNRYLTINGPDCDNTTATGSSCHNTCAGSYQDFDRDGHGNAGVPVTRCHAPFGYVASSDDCDDASAYAWDTCATCVDNDADTYYQACNNYYAEVTAGGTATTSTTLPLAASKHDERTQVIYLASELGPAATIYSVALNVSTIPGQVLNNFTIRMKPTDLDSFSVSSWEGPASGWTTVYQHNEPSTPYGWHTFELDTPFDYDGARNLMVDFSFNNASSSTAGASRGVNLAAYRCLYFSTNSAYGDPLTWTGTANPPPSRTTYLPQLRFYFQINGPDCDDTSALVNSGRTEVPCDDLDNDCNPATPDDWDADGDGLGYCDEFSYGTSDAVADSDGDGLRDGPEVNLYRTSPTNWDSDGDRLADGYEAASLAHPGATLDPMNAADGAADFDGDGNSNANEIWNGSDPWTADPAPGEFDNPGCYYWADGDGDGNPAPSDVIAIRLRIAGAEPTYQNILPHGSDTLDLDRDGNVAPSDWVLLSLMVAGAERPGGYPSQASSLEVVAAPTGSVAAGSTARVTVSVHSVSGTVPYAPGYGVVFTVSGNAVLLGGDGTADGEAAGNRYDISMEAAAGAQANIVVLITGPGAITIGAKVPGCGEPPYGRWNHEVVLSPAVVINP
jgi:hypothetical protein